VFHFKVETKFCNIVTNFSELETALKGTPYEWMLKR